MRLVSRVINNQSIESLKKVINKTIADSTPYLNSVKDTQKEILYGKIKDLNNWYTRIIGLDEVKLCQDRVISLQDRLLDAQEKRREVSHQLSTIREKSTELQDKIHKIKREHQLDTFLDLMKQETEILKLEKQISHTLADFDKMERELFTAFTNAIRDSHEKQRAQLEYTKYFSLILSITGSFLAFCYTSFRKRDLKKFINEKFDSNEPLMVTLLHMTKKNQETLQNLQFNATDQTIVEVDSTYVYKAAAVLCVAFLVFRLLG